MGSVGVVHTSPDMYLINVKIAAHKRRFGCISRGYSFTDIVFVWAGQMGGSAPSGADPSTENMLLTVKSMESRHYNVYELSFMVRLRVEYAQHIWKSLNGEAYVCFMLFIMYIFIIFTGVLVSINIST